MSHKVQILIPDMDSQQAQEEAKKIEQRLLLKLIRAETFAEAVELSDMITDVRKSLKQYLENINN